MVASPATALVKLVLSFVRLPLPSSKNCQGFFAHQLSHGNASRLQRPLQLLINERVIESSIRRVGRNSSVEDARRTRPINRAHAHRTRLARGVERAIG